MRLTINKVSNTNRLNQTAILYLTIVRLLVGYKSILTNFFKLLNTSNTRQFKSLFIVKPSFSIRQYNLTSLTKTKNTPPRVEKKLFDTIVKLNGWLVNKNLVVHTSFKGYFIYSNLSNTGFFNLSKFTSIWLNLLTCLDNIFFFNLNFLAFGNPYFKKEVLSLNFFNTKLVKSWGKFIDSFIFFLNNKTSTSTEFYFKKIKSMGYIIFIIVDVYYHKKTLFYLNKLGLLTVGPVPVYANMYTLFISLPTSSNSVFSNLFFFRLIMRVKKLARKRYWTVQNHYY